MEQPSNFKNAGCYNLQYSIYNLQYSRVCRAGIRFRLLHTFEEIEIGELYPEVKIETGYVVVTNIRAQFVRTEVAKMVSHCKAHTVEVVIIKAVRQGHFKKCRLIPDRCGDVVRPVDMRHW